MRARAGTALVAIVVAAGCGSSAPRATTTTSTTSAHATDADFCQRWHDAFVSQKQGAQKALLRDAPQEIADAAELLRTADEKASTPETDAAVKRVTDWIAVNCPTESGRHVAPPAGTDLAGLRACSVLAVPQLLETATEAENAALYGEAARADPYDGPMLGVFSAKGGDGGVFAGDGDRTPVTVRGRAGWAA